MICNCFNPKHNLAALAKKLSRAADSMVGMPDYDTYAAHMATNHPGEAIPSRKTFFQERQTARYGGTGSFKCC